MLDEEPALAAISCGKAGRRPACSLDMMIAAADEAMYQAIGKGRCHIEVATTA
jgi:PleD family two-component response regulator